MSSESSSNGGRSRPGLDVIGSLPLLERAGLVTAEKGSEDGSSCESGHREGLKVWFIDNLYSNAKIHHSFRKYNIHFEIE